MLLSSPLKIHLDWILFVCDGSIHQHLMDAETKGFEGHDTERKERKIHPRNLR